MSIDCNDNDQYLVQLIDKLSKAININEPSLPDYQYQYTSSAR